MNEGKNNLRMVRILDASIMDVFKACTEPEGLKKWFAPRKFKVAEVTNEARQGGDWRVCMVSPEDERHCVSGKYVAFDPPASLAFSFAWDGEDGGTGHVSEVSVNIEDFHGKTLLTFLHQNFESEEARDAHEEGWCTCLEKLAESL